jgi:hypothetical protein
MQRLLMAGLFTGLLVTLPPASADESWPPAAESSAPQRYDAYQAYPVGLRFRYPEGYWVDSATAYRSPDPEAQLKDSWQIWKAEDYIPLGGIYSPEIAGPESPPHISLEVLRNPDDRPLQEWVGRAADWRVITVAGQGAIAYTDIGLYESDVVLLRHPSGDILRLQADYLDAADPLRSVFQTVLESLTLDTATATGHVTEIDYRYLQATLSAGDWAAANLETISILMQLTGGYDYYYPYIETDDIESIPCADLQIMDALWSRYSEGHYGLSPQQALWRSLATADATQQAEEYGQRVGWRREAPLDTWLGDSLWRLDTELTYTAEAPAGHLPWLGVPSLTLDRMLQNSGPACGSCTIDAIYISGDRFPDFLDTWMARLDDCLCPAPDARDATEP